MRVRINGKELSDLEKREQQYFETVKAAAYIFLGGVCILCGSILFDILAGLPFDFGTDRIITAIAAVLQK